MNKLLMPLIAACVAIGGAAPVLAQFGGPPFGKKIASGFAIFIDGKTKNIELWTTDDPEWLIKNKDTLSLHADYTYTGGRVLGRGKCNLPPNSSIGAFRNASLDFVTGTLFQHESDLKRNSKLVVKSDELRKDGTYVAVIKQTMLGYHP